MKIENSLLIKIIFMLSALFIIGCGSSSKVDSEHNTTVKSTDGSDITYKVQGEGNITIIFVHGWAGEHQIWRNQIEFFSTKYRVAWLDLAGHGLSGTNRQNYTMLSFGEDVASVVNKIGANKIVLVGHSMGGVVIMEAAKLLKEKVVAIVGVDSFYTSFNPIKTKQEVDEYMRAFENNFKIATGEMVRDMFPISKDQELITLRVNQMSSTDKDIGISSFREMFKWSEVNIPSALDKYSDKLHNINAASTKEEITLVESVVLIPEVGHFIPEVKPIEFNRVLDEIVSQL